MLHGPSAVGVATAIETAVSSVPRSRGPRARRPRRLSAAARAGPGQEASSSGPFGPSSLPASVMPARTQEVAEQRPDLAARPDLDDRQRPAEGVERSPMAPDHVVSPVAQM